MSLGAYCGYTIVGGSGMCPFHTAGLADDRARESRIMCDFIHRGFDVPVPDEDVILEAA